MAKPKRRSWREGPVKSDWDTKINERSAAKQIPLMDVFPSYIDWGTEAQRWAMMLYNRPVSLGIDYSIVN